MQSIRESLRPTQKPNVIDLVSQAGFDVSDWSNYDGSPGRNPKYCYEWCFTELDRSLVNIWFERLIERDGTVIQNLNMRRVAAREQGQRRARALRFDQVISDAFKNRSELRAIILNRPSSGGSTTGRRLDTEPWQVATYDAKNGDFTISRGSRPPAVEPIWEPSIQEFIEGEIRTRLARHRKRERAARTAKILQALEQNNNRLCCEVPGCGFDFLAVYGEAGRGYAHVHHTLPLAQLPSKGGATSLADLAIVCANCHAMIHRGGACRNIADLIVKEQ